MRAGVLQGSKFHFWFSYLCWSGFLRLLITTGHYLSVREKRKNIVRKSTTRYAKIGRKDSTEHQCHMCSKGSGAGDDRAQVGTSSRITAGRTSVDHTVQPSHSGLIGLLDAIPALKGVLPKSFRLSYNNGCNGRKEEQILIIKSHLV